MSVNAVTKELSRLCYSDMLILAKHIRAQLPNGTPHTTETIAEVLAGLNNSEIVKPDPSLKQTNEILRKAFSSRQKTIHVAILQSGWQVTFGKHVAVGINLSDAINHLLDQLVCLKLMGVN